VTDATANKATNPFVMTTLLVAADKDEAFWGFGEQFTYINQRGRVLRHITMEL